MLVEADRHRLSAARLPRDQLKSALSEVVRDILVELSDPPQSANEHAQLVDVGGRRDAGSRPAGAAAADETVTDIMVNRFDRVYVERRGKIELTDVTFRDPPACLQHRQPDRQQDRPADRREPPAVRRAAGRTAAASTSWCPRCRSTGRPMSIRKFAKRSITFDRMVEQANLSDSMSALLKDGGRARGSTS